MAGSAPTLFIHGFIGSFDVAGFDSPHAAPALLGYGAFRDAAPEAISLPAQVEHLRAFVDEHLDGAVVDLVGHSVGGAIAMLFAHAHPERVGRIVNVEGNFTLDDAFWSASVGRMSQEQARDLLQRLQDRPLDWLRGAIPEAPAHMADTARRWLGLQPASTLQAMGRSVIEVTGNPGYLGALREVFDRHPVYLLSGERSHAGWNVPGWAWAQCEGQARLAGCGHLMAAERPEDFAAAVRDFLG